MEHRLTDAAIRQQIARSTWTMFGLYAASLLVVAALTRSVVAAALIALFAVGAVALTRRRLRNMLAQFVLVVSDNSISVRSSAVLAPAEIPRSDVASIEERQGLGLTVRDRQRRFIGVPLGIEGYERIRDLLRSWQPIELKPRSYPRLWTAIASAATVAGFAAVLLTSDPGVVIPIGAAVAIALLLSIVLVLRSPIIDGKIKRRMLFAVLPLIAVVARIVQVITQ